jgi:cell wall-associated NlpC family hydrolase
MARVLLALAGDDLVRIALRAAAGLALVVAVAAVGAVVAVTALLAAAAGVRPAIPSSAGTSSASAPAAVPGARDAAVVAVAGSFLDTPYVWGGASPATGFDCSGLVQWSYRQVGVALPRTAQQQYDATTRVGREQLRPGDMVFFAQTYPSAELVTHVGVYAGDGLMVNAPVEGKPISLQPVFTGFWGAHYAGAGRPAGGS